MASSPAGFALFVFFFALIPVDGSLAQYRPAGARLIGLGRASSALVGEVWPAANPASPAVLPSIRVSFFAEEPYSLPELRLGAVAGSIPLFQGITTLGAASFGYDSYRESTFDLGYAVTFRPSTRRPIFGGVRITYENVRIQGYGSGVAVGLSVGAIVEMIPSLWFGSQIVNVNAPRIGRDEREQSLSAGLVYRFLDSGILAVDVIKAAEFPVSLHTGLEIQLVDILSVRGGVRSEPYCWSAGAGIRTGPLNTDLAVERHQWLGWTPALTIGLSW